MAKGIIRNMQEELGEISADLTTDIPDYNVIKDHRQANNTIKKWTLPYLLLLKS